MDTMTKVEQKLGTVMHMAWEMATKKLELNRQIIRRHDESSRKGLVQEYDIPTNESQYQTLAKIYNHLIDAHEKLEEDSSILLVHTFDPSCGEDPVHRITQSVSNWLLDEIYAIGGVLQESRQTIRLRALSS